MRIMMVLAFRAYLRVGQMAPRSNDDTKGCLKLGDVSVSSGIITIQFKNFINIALGPKCLIYGQDV